MSLTREPGLFKTKNNFNTWCSFYPWKNNVLLLNDQKLKGAFQNGNYQLVPNKFCSGMLHDIGFTQFGKKSFVCTILWIAILVNRKVKNDGGCELIQSLCKQPNKILAVTAHA